MENCTYKQINEILDGNDTDLAQDIVCMWRLYTESRKHLFWKQINIILFIKLDKGRAW